MKSFIKKAICTLALIGIVSVHSTFAAALSLQDEAFYPTPASLLANMKLVEKKDGYSTYRDSYGQIEYVVFHDNGCVSFIETNGIECNARTYSEDGRTIRITAYGDPDGEVLVLYQKDPQDTVVGRYSGKVKISPDGVKTAEFQMVTVRAEGKPNDQITAKDIMTFNYDDIADIPSDFYQKIFKTVREADEEEWLDYFDLDTF
ncbi:Hypothetical protein LUCI_2669 [Lucifera butyrica]|uniref:Uncharacterized protein n=1 Tax=Lucifera butyrica TaxID=1351585 RepID=A0A498R919_9FIRM|nr:hypothetical protein [Lucifera butyrica]VBB07420.1 Hypothetical protein LUCI_2669 [Lucifera butyrica]